jgi:hypothetical protein
MREELERREAATGKARSEEEAARARLKVCLQVWCVWRGRVLACALVCRSCAALATLVTSS